MMLGILLRCLVEIGSSCCKEIVMNIRQIMRITEKELLEEKNIRRDLTTVKDIFLSNVLAYSSLNMIIHLGYSDSPSVYKVARKIVRRVSRNEILNVLQI